MSHQVRVIRGHWCFEQAVGLKRAWEGRLSAKNYTSVLIVFSRSATFQQKHIVILTRMYSSNIMLSTSTSNRCETLGVEAGK